jgi:large subunit ribosomal protein L21
MNNEENNDMFAIIKCGGKQYRVQKNDVIDVELIDQEKGSKIEFGDILFVGNGQEFNFGNPHLGTFFVKGELVDFVKGPKITSIKYQPGNHYKKFGHRQKYCRVKITDIGSNKQKGAHHGT